MFLLFLIGIASALLVVLLTLFIFHKKDAQKCPGGVPLRSHGDLIRRAQIARSQRYRLRQNATSLELVNGSLDVNGSEEEVLNLSNRQVLMDEKIGTKKRAKLEAKEQKRIIHKQELKIREGRKIEEAKMQREKQKLEEKEAEEQRQMELAEEATRREKERREYEAYLEMREGFIIEEEGFEEADSVQKDNLLSEFIEYVKTNKIVVLDDLAVEFKLKTQQIIDRVKDLQVNGKLTGVIDDRGKFIFISEEELVSVAKFIKQRGRISIAELAESSNNLINLAAVNSA